MASLATSRITGSSRCEENIWAIRRKSFCVCGVCDVDGRRRPFLPLLTAMLSASSGDLGFAAGRFRQKGLGAVYDLKYVSSYYMYMGERRQVKRIAIRPWRLIKNAPTPQKTSPRRADIHQRAKQAVRPGSTGLDDDGTKLNKNRAAPNETARLKTIINRHAAPRESTSRSPSASPKTSRGAWRRYRRP